MFGWLRRKPAPLSPESLWRVTIDDDAIHVMDDQGGRSAVAIRDLSGVAIETNDSGPWGIDLWWLLFDADDRMAGAVPQGATGEQALIDFAMTLPDFDHQKMTKAMRSTANASFALWRAPDRR